MAVVWDRRTQLLAGLIGLVALVLAVAVAVRWPDDDGRERLASRLTANEGTPAPDESTTTPQPELGLKREPTSSTSSSTVPLPASSTTSTTAAPSAASAPPATSAPRATSTTTATTAPPTTSTTSRTDATAEAECSAPEGGRETYATKAQAAERLTTVWVVCGTPAVTWYGDALEFTDDGRYFVLHENDRGEFERSTNWDETGRWEIQQGDPTKPDYSLSMYRDSGGVHPNMIAFAKDAKKLRLMNPQTTTDLVEVPIDRAEPAQ